MTNGALCDIHGNLPALDVVLREIAVVDIDRIVIRGDVVPGPMSSECLDAISNLDVPVNCSRGNCENAILQQLGGSEPPGIPERAREAMRWIGRQLTQKQVEWISDGRSR